MRPNTLKKKERVFKRAFALCLNSNGGGKGRGGKKREGERKEGIHAPSFGYRRERGEMRGLIFPPPFHVGEI